jgi:hypothetical protein
MKPDEFRVGYRRQVIRSFRRRRGITYGFDASTTTKSNHQQQQQQQLQLQLQQQQQPPPALHHPASSPAFTTRAMAAIRIPHYSFY